MRIPAFKLLLDAIQKSDHRHHRHATLVMRAGSLVSVGYNRGFRHSEVVAVNSLWPSKRIGCYIINLRITRGGVFGMARPCSKCQEYLKANKIGKVIYYDGTGWITERL